jgi:hypothetical protein
MRVAREDSSTPQEVDRNHQRSCSLMEVRWRLSSGDTERVRVAQRTPLDDYSMVRFAAFCRSRGGGVYVSSRQQGRFYQCALRWGYAPTVRCCLTSSSPESKCALVTERTHPAERATLRRMPISCVAASIPTQCKSVSARRLCARAYVNWLTFCQRYRLAENSDALVGGSPIHRRSSRQSAGSSLLPEQRGSWTVDAELALRPIRYHLGAPLGK